MLQSVATSQRIGKILFYRKYPVCIFLPVCASICLLCAPCLPGVDLGLGWVMAGGFALKGSVMMTTRCPLSCWVRRSVVLCLVLVGEVAVGVTGVAGGRRPGLAADAIGADGQEACDYVKHVVTCLPSAVLATTPEILAGRETVDALTIQSEMTDRIIALVHEVQDSVNSGGGSGNTQPDPIAVTTFSDEAIPNAHEILDIGDITQFSIPANMQMTCSGTHCGEADRVVHAIRGTADLNIYLEYNQVVLDNINLTSRYGVSVTGQVTIYNNHEKEGIGNSRILNDAMATVTMRTPNMRDGFTMDARSDFMIGNKVEYDSNKPDNSGLLVYSIDTPYDTSQGEVPDTLGVAVGFDHKDSDTSLNGYFNSPTNSQPN